MIWGRLDATGTVYTSTAVEGTRLKFVQMLGSQQVLLRRVSGIPGPSFGFLMLYDPETDVASELHFWNGGAELDFVRREALVVGPNIYYMANAVDPDDADELQALVLGQLPRVVLDQGFITTRLLGLSEAGGLMLYLQGGSRELWRPRVLRYQQDLSRDSAAARQRGLGHA